MLVSHAKRGRDRRIYEFCSLGYEFSKTYERQACDPSEELEHANSEVDDGAAKP